LSFFSTTSSSSCSVRTYASQSSMSVRLGHNNSV
jgi:hypothetical protein